LCEREFHSPRLMKPPGNASVSARLPKNNCTNLVRENY
jgi:hypothetical protein